MKRATHLFQFTGKGIGEAAAAEAEYHKGRVAWWKTEQDKAIVLAKAAGVEVREHDVTGGENVQVVIDPTVQSRLNECASKISSHRRLADDFTIQAACYATQSAVFYDLDPDDVNYFRLAGGPREE